MNCSVLYCENMAMLLLIHVCLCIIRIYSSYFKEVDEIAHAHTSLDMIKAEHNLLSHIIIECDDNYNFINCVLGE